MGNESILLKSSYTVHEVPGYHLKVDCDMLKKSATNPKATTEITKQSYS